MLIQADMHIYVFNWYIVVKTTLNARIYAYLGLLNITCIIHLDQLCIFLIALAKYVANMDTSQPHERLLAAVESQFV